MFSAIWCETNECVDDGISVPKRAKKYLFHNISSSNRNLPVDLKVLTVDRSLFSSGKKEKKIYI
jgi:hypothetical protein